MHRLISPLVCVAALLAAALPALAQATAQQTYQQAATAYQQGDFAAARDLAQKASQTDPNNPEVFLLLGKAHYMLGSLDAALEAWQRTLKLAPDEPYAKQMVSALQAEKAGVDARIAVVEALVGERLFPEAIRQAAGVLKEKVLSEAQRARLLTLQAEALVGTHQPGEAQDVLRQLLVLYPQQADAAQTALLLGQAKLQAGGESTAEGLAVLKGLVAGHPDAPAAATARYELLQFDLAQGVTPERVEAMAGWVAGNAANRRAKEARQALLRAYFALTRQAGTPTPDAPLNPTDVKALALAAEILSQNAEAGPGLELAAQVLAHLEAQYGSRGANAAALAGVETLLAAPLPRNARLPVLKAQARYQTAIALRRLDEQAEAGRLPVTAEAGSLPEGLAAVLAVYETINKEFPAEPGWGEQAGLVGRMRAYAPKVLVPGVAEQLRAPEVWAVSIALPVIQANADAAMVRVAVEQLRQMIGEYSAADSAGSRQAAAELSAALVKAVSPESPAWPDAMQSRALSLDSLARYTFNENLKSGNSQRNAALSEAQKELLSTLKAHVARRAEYAPVAVLLLGNHLQPWVGQGHWAVAEESYAMLAEALPQPQRLEVDLAAVNLWAQRVFAEHARLTAAGLSVPRQLDPVLQKALARCCQLQAGLDPDSGQLRQVRAFWDAIVAHYKDLEYYDVAEAAVRVRAEPPVEAADEYAAFQLVQLTDEQGRRELAESLKQYGAPEKLALGATLKEAIAGWTKFVADRPTGPLASAATQRVFEIGRLFEQHEAFEVAAGVYRDLAGFAAGVEMLSRTAPGGSSTAEQAAFAAATATDAQARKTLAKQTAQRKPDEPPPSQLSAEYAAAIKAYVELAKAREQSPLAGAALDKVLGVANEYAKIDAWEVAEGVYGGLLDSGLVIRRPERLKFAQGVCQLGRAIPEHARQVLVVLTSAGVRGPGSPAPDVSRLALSGRLSNGQMSAALGALTELGGARGGTTTSRGSEWSSITSDRAVVAAGVAAEDAPLAFGQRPSEQPSDVAYSGDGGMGVGGYSRRAASQPSPEAAHDAQLLAMIRQQEAARAAQVAQLHEGNIQFDEAMRYQQVQQQAEQQIVRPAAPVLSEAELKRQEAAIAAAYEVFQGIRKDYPDSATAEQARGEILVMVGHWRGLGQSERSAELALRFLADNPTDGELPRLRLEIARDRLAWAARPIERKLDKQEMLSEVTKRFDAARADLAKIVSELPEERSLQQQAQWDAANSYLTQARVVNAFSPTLARGQYVRATRELREVAQKYPGHPQLGNIPQTLWTVFSELQGRGYDEEAIVVLNELTTFDPMHPLAQQASRQIADTYWQKLKRPLLAAEVYQELYFAGGGRDSGLLDTIFQIGSELKNQKRYVEALHVLGTFVDSAPRHAQAGQALTMIGQIHQTNEAWEEAITAYRRVIDQYQEGPFIQEAKWAIAECRINLSRWHEAAEAYREFVAAYPQDGRLAEANRRMEVLKDLARYQGLVDEEGQRRATDAQFQIAKIVADNLANPVKAIIEYRKVVAGWPESHWADDSLYAVGATYLSLGEPEKAREALLQVAEKYPTSPLADDALLMVGNSYDSEATKLATVTRGEALALNVEQAQKRAYQTAKDDLSRQQSGRGGRITELKAEGKTMEAAEEEAAQAFSFGQFNDANVRLLAEQAKHDVEAQTAVQLADRQDKINAALRKAVEAYGDAAKVVGADKADEALLQMATIYDQRLKDAQAAVETWLEITRQFSGTAVAEDASWRLAQYYEREGNYAEAIKRYWEFLQNYGRSPKAGDAQFALAENYEQLGQWVSAMDSYTNYINRFPDGPLRQKAQEQINWIKTYRL